MRLEIDNWTEMDVRPYLELAAKVVNVPGRVWAKVHYTKNGLYSGWAMPRSKRIRIGMPRDRENFKGWRNETLGYFRSHKIPLKKPYEVNTWEELLVDIAAHEFAHLMPRGDTQKFRKSVAELWCEKKAAEAIELLRTEEGQKFVRDFHNGTIERAKARSEKRARLTAIASSVEGRVMALRVREKRWQTKAKRAETALKKIRRAIRRLEKRACQESQQAASSAESHITQ